MLSASHNPYHDNGIKFFGGDGYKLSDATEAEIEAALDAAAGRARRIRAACARFHGALEDYLRALARALRRPRPAPAAGSCSTAPTARPTAPRRRSSAASAPTSTCSPHEPDGRNINDGCGSTHLERARRRRCTAGDDDAGFAFDGDGDRVLAVDRNGAVVDGDELIALAALHLRDAGRLPGDGVAVTVMTNYGFHTAMRERGHRGRDHRRSATATCSRRCASAAGRSAASSPGHIIDLRLRARPATASPPRCSRSRRSAARDLADRHAMEKLPQTLVNVRVARPRRARRAPTRVARGGRARVGGARGPRPRARAPERHRAAGARDGRGADAPRRPTRSASGSSRSSRRELA